MAFPSCLKDILINASNTFHIISHTMLEVGFIHLRNTEREAQLHSDDF